MPELKHLVVVDAPVEAVYRALTEQAGLAGWWTRDTVAEPTVGSIAEFRFGDRYRNRMRIVDLDENRRVGWTCIDGDEQWVGTTFLFTLEPREDGTTVRFTHGGWREATDFFAACNTIWGGYMQSLRSFCETGKGEPFE